jgi:hypothetical protein
MLTEPLPPLGSAPCNLLISAYAAFLTQNKLDDCPSHFENAHLFSPMNLHLQHQERFFSLQLPTSGVLLNASQAASGADSSFTPNE